MEGFTFLLHSDWLISIDFIFYLVDSANIFILFNKYVAIQILQIFLLNSFGHEGLKTLKEGLSSIPSLLHLWKHLKKKKQT